MSDVSNISCYCFAPLTDLKELREELLVLCKKASLKGTILLSTEGINFFIAGPADSIQELVRFLRQVPGLEGLNPKWSESDHQPFSRMLVRIKKEIIAFGVEGIDPARYTSPRLEARELKQWLDEGRPVVLYDTRNDYEVRLGTFKNAIPAGTNTFREFPDAVARLPEELKDAPIVTFCTGGIRCEKAAPFMESVGFREVYQLEGGILKYFEEVGGDHYEGECFVFDRRVGLDPGLRETSTDVCFACQTPLDAEEQKDPRFVPGVSCPHCYKSDEAVWAERMEKHRQALKRATHPLPGSQPYDNVCPVRIPGTCDGFSLIEALGQMFSHVEPSFWLGLFAEGKLQFANGKPASPDTIVRAGERYLRLLPATVEPEVATAIQLIAEDESIIVVNKPAPLPMHPGGRFNRHTLQSFMNAAWAPERPRAIHRLDANTTGLVVFGRSRSKAGRVQEAFKSGDVEKLYLVRAQGHIISDAFTVDVPISRIARISGSRTVDEEEGQEARTEFKVRSRDADGTTLLEARPITGRTNQIRVHLWHLGHPVLGDPTYLTDGKLGNTQTLAADDERILCLHAWKLTFPHPGNGKIMTFEAEAPAWAKPR